MTSGSDVTLLLSDGATSNGKNAYLRLTGTMTANISLIIPASTTVAQQQECMLFKMQQIELQQINIR